MPDPASKESSPSPQPSRRRWLQFSLRTLLGYLFFVPVGLAWYVRARHKSLKQWEAVRALQAAGGQLTVMYDEELPEEEEILPAPGWQQLLGIDLPQDSTFLHWERGTFTEEHAKHLDELPQLIMIAIETDASPEIVPYLVRLPKLQSLVISRSKFTDESIEQLAHSPRLNYVILTSSLVTDQGLEHLKNCTRLRTLSITSPLVTDAALAPLAQCQSLKSLCLTSNRITDAGMASLDNFHNLNSLTIVSSTITDAGIAQLQIPPALPFLGFTNSQITDAGLEYFTGAKQLQYLLLMQSKITPAGIATLKQALPNLEIIGP